MNICANADIRTLTSTEIDLIFGGGGPAPVETYAFTQGNTNYYNFTCPEGYGVQGISNGQMVDPVTSDIYNGGFGCKANGDVQQVTAYQQSGSGGWTDYSNNAG